MPENKNGKHTREHSYIKLFNYEMYHITYIAHLLIYRQQYIYKEYYRSNIKDYTPNTWKCDVNNIGNTTHYTQNIF